MTDEARIAAEMIQRLEDQRDAALLGVPEYVVRMRRTLGPDLAATVLANQPPPWAPKPVDWAENTRA